MNAFKLAAQVDLDPLIRERAMMYSSNRCRFGLHDSGEMFDSSFEDCELIRESTRQKTSHEERNPGRSLTFEIKCLASLTEPFNAQLPSDPHRDKQYHHVILQPLFHYQEALALRDRS